MSPTYSLKRLLVAVAMFGGLLVAGAPLLQECWELYWWDNFQTGTTKQEIFNKLGPPVDIRNDSLWSYPTNALSGRSTVLEFDAKDRLISKN